MSTRATHELVLSAQGSGSVVEQVRRVAGADAAVVRWSDEGNERYLNGEQVHPGTDEMRRVEVALKQEPFAAILTCADSRVPVEIVTDQGFGDLFVVRVAGNVVGSAVTANKPGQVGIGAVRVRRRRTARRRAASSTRRRTRIISTSRISCIATSTPPPST